MSSCLAHRRSEDRVRSAARRPSPSAAAADLLEDEAGGDPSVGCVVVVVDVDEAQAARRMRFGPRRPSNSES